MCAVGERERERRPKPLRYNRPSFRPPHLSPRTDPDYLLAAMSTEKLIRITTLIPRKKGMTEKEFYKHWTEVHGPMVVDFMMRHGVVEYRQV